MRIGELSRRTGVPTRMLRYYEEQGLLSPDRTDNGYRSYLPETVSVVGQIRGLLDAGLTTEIVGRLLPFLDGPDEVHVHPDCLTGATRALLENEVDRIQRRIDCLARNRDAILTYLEGVQRRVSD